ncbi:DNA polymerase III subunit delta' [Acidisoma cellulosilytica]|uniref:DNA polymerase III subunit delta n=1 Tax=Acidisoma cellulosilyticum TaxID=2802395 RepID=A0A963YZ33_9PROT|nr:DNA polymerase III subunit delta' [Acidisoma cellulosilyticum]MCB8879519.1 DNA polymerase III subunit delta' [Acidisoma cellulosilyticum]
MTHLPPRENPDLLGHDAAERLWRAARRSGRLHHAWLITGTRGIGKATLAFRLARALLAGLPPDADLQMDPAEPVFRRIAAGTHAGLMVLERSADEKTKRMRRDIVVDEVRAVTQFLRRTAGEGGARIVIVDGAEDMNTNAANALLKLLEEPPPGALLFLVCHAPGLLPTTIRSRCRRLRLSPLTEPDVETLLGRYLPDLGVEEQAEMARLAEGSIGRALTLAAGDGPAMAAEVHRVLATLPTGQAALHVADGVARDEDSFGLFMDLLRQAIADVVRQGARGALSSHQTGLLARRSIDDWGKVWQALTQIQDETERFALDRRQAVLAGLSLMAGT